MENLPKLIEKTNFSTFLDGFDNVMTDCDGVLWSSGHQINGASDVLNKLRKLGKRIFYVTNNSTKTRETLVMKCQEFGFIAEKDEAISTSFILAQHLKNINFKKKVYIMGSEGIANELENVAISHLGVGPDPPPENIFSLEENLKLDPEVGAVVVGFDAHFNIPKVMKAASYLKNPNCLFLATNRDERFPIRNEHLIFPGTGVFVKAVETACGRTAESIGKPNPKMFTVLQDKFSLDPKRTLMIGDRYPVILATKMQKLATAQNNAVRVIMGCLPSTLIRHLQAETRILLIEAHMDMLGCQLYIKCLNHESPLHHTLQ